MIHEHTNTSGNVAQEWEVLRIMIFPERPDMLILYAPTNAEFFFPQDVHPPFTKIQIAQACAAEGIPVRITEGPLGRWTDHWHAMRRAEKAERGQKVNQTAAVKAAIEKNGAPLAKTRAEATERKLSVDTKIREAKDELKAVRLRGARDGLMLPRHTYQNMERKLADLKIESQALQVKLGELRKTESKELKTAIDEEDTRFRKVAKHFLTPEMMEKILTRMSEMEDGEEIEGGDHGTADDEEQ